LARSKTKPLPDVLQFALERRFVRAFPPTGTASAVPGANSSGNPELGTGFASRWSTQGRPADRLDQFSVNPLRLGPEALPYVPYRGRLCGPSPTPRYVPEGPLLTQKGGFCFLKKAGREPSHYDE
jgi:hypothetical protein